MAAATAAGSDTSRRGSIGRGSASTGSGRTSASLLGVREYGLVGHERRSVPPVAGADSERALVDADFLTIVPPIASMPRFIALLVSRIQPISPPVDPRRGSAMSKCST